MEILKLLEQLKRIEARPDYVRQSRYLILHKEEKPVLSPGRFILQSLQFGSAVALASLLLIFIVGGLATWKFISPFKLTSLDPGSLRAEAEAIDIQIELTDIVYPDSRGETTVESASPKAPEVKAQAKAEAEELGVRETEETSIEEALDLLAE